MTATTSPETPTFAPSRAQRLALHFLQLGAIAVVLVASTHRAFELDRFLIPKELVLHVTAVSAALLMMRAIARTIGWIDLLLMAWLLLGAVSVATTTNYWLGMRALAVSASCVAIFWTARALRAAGLARPLLGALAFAVVVAASTSLLQAYGVQIELFSPNRAPGGTLGNRNFVAHAAAFGLPICMLVALLARRSRGYIIAVAGVAIVTASLVLTRSRAAWVAAAVMLLIFFLAVVVSGPLRRDGRTWRRLASLIIVAVGSVAAALIIPNTLRWRSDNPYLDSVVGVANYEEGSGRGRLVQYEQSLRMAAANPLLGVGPGNWSVEYPEYTVRNDPSMDTSERGMTFNPWPSSDWVAFASERGFPGSILMALVFCGIAANGFRRLVNARDPEEGLMAAALLATAAAAVVAGMFDAVLLLALPGLLVWAALGALWSPVESRPRAMRAIVVVAVIACAALGAARSAAQLAAMDIYATRQDRASLELASRIDPGNYRIHLRLARRCAHARAAHALFPNAGEARDLSRACGD
jgi:O-antigen ligase